MRHQRRTHQQIFSNLKSRVLSKHGGDRENRKKSDVLKNRTENAGGDDGTKEGCYKTVILAPEPIFHNFCSLQANSLFQLAN